MNLEGGDDAKRRAKAWLRLVREMEAPVAMMEVWHIFAPMQPEDVAKLPDSVMDLESHL